jgi:hypothetical protein
MSRTETAFAPQQLRWKRTLTLALMGLVALAACADGVSSPGPMIAASDGETIEEKETISGEPFALTAGVCPKGYVLSAVKPGHIADANDNGWICVSGTGDTVDDETAVGVGTCPDGFDLLLAKPGHPADLNGNGWVCAGEKVTIDDEFVTEDRMKVNGHGNFTSSGKKELQDISFSFHAIPIGTELDGKGRFEFHDQLHGLNVHGAVECVATQGTSAFIAAVVTRSDDTGLPVGTLVGWFARDNAEPGGGIDAMTRPAPIKKKIGETACSGVRFPGMSVIQSGNIQVH